MTCARGRNRRAYIFAAVTTMRQEGHSFLYFQALTGAKVKLNLTFTGILKRALGVDGNGRWI